MSTETKIRRGTSSQCNAITPADGEVLYDQTNDRLRVGDGAKAGGFHQASAADVQNQKFTAGTSGGIVNAYTLTVDQPPASYQAGQSFEFSPGVVNTGASTFDAGAGAVAINKVVAGALAAVAAGDLPAGIRQRVVHTGSVWQLMGGSGGVSAVTGTGGITVTGTTAPAVSIDTNNALGIGSYCMMYCLGNISAGATATSTLLRYANMKTTGNTNSAVAPSGTWRNMSGYLLNNLITGIFMRVA